MSKQLRLVYPGEYYQVMNNETGDQWLFIESNVDISLPGHMPIVVERTYDSQVEKNNAFGYGWTMNYEKEIFRTYSIVISTREAPPHSNLPPSEIQSQKIRLLLQNGSGRGIAFERESGIFMPPNFPTPYEEIKSEQFDGGVNCLVVYYKNGLREIYKKYSGNNNYIDKTSEPILKTLLWKTIDRNNNYIEFNYDDELKIETISNNDGNTVTFTYNKNKHIIKTEDNYGKFVEYSYDELGNLIEFTNSAGIKTGYDYWEWGINK